MSAVQPVIKTEDYIPILTDREQVLAVARLAE